MKSLLQALAWYADTVLSICYPLETKPGLDDAAALADKEAQEDVAEPQCVCCDEVGSGGRVDPGDVWPEQPDPLGHIVALLEDIHNILQRSPLLMPNIPDTAPVEAAAKGEPNLENPMFWSSDLFGAAQTLLCMADGTRRKPTDHDVRLLALAGRLSDIAEALSALK